MHRSNCPRAGATLYSVPGPLFSHGERQSGEPPAALAAAPVLPLLRLTGAEEMRICRHTNPIPAPAPSGLGEALCLLRQENELLLEILAAINALTAATLAKKS